MAAQKVDEKWVKKKVVDHLKSYGIYYFFPISGGFGRSGVPDIVACVKGKFVGIECKAGKNTTTALQDKNINDIRSNQGVAFVVNEDTLDHMRMVIDELISGEIGGV